MTLRLRRDTVEYFEQLPQEVGSSYGTLTELYLAKCAENRRTSRRDHISEPCRVLDPAIGHRFGQLATMKVRKKRRKK